MSTVRNALFISFAHRNAILLIQFGASLVVARLLTPHEIGIFSIGSVIVSFSHIVRDLGVSSYLIQERELSRERVRSAQTIVLVTSWLIALLLVLLAKPATAFYREPGVGHTMRILAISFVLLPLGSVTVALLQREMRFGKLFAVGLIGALAQNLVAIFLAWFGFGFASLAWGAVAGVAGTVVGALAFRTHGQPWMPGRRECRRVFSVGSKLSGSAFFNEVGLGGPDLVIGRTLGFDAVGYYSRAFGACTVVYRALVDGVVSVATPYFARQDRDGLGSKAPYLRGLAYMSVVSIPAFACLAIGAEPLVALLYGTQWLASVPPLRVICVGLGSLAVGNIAGSVLLGSGQIGTSLRLQAFFQSAKILLVIYGSTSGLLGASVCVAVADVGLSVCSILRANKQVGATVGESLAATFPGLIVAAGTAGAAWLLLEFLPVFLQANAFQLVALATTSAIVWVGLVMALKHPISFEIRRVAGACRSRLFH